MSEAADRIHHSATARWLRSGRDSDPEQPERTTNYSSSAKRWFRPVRDLVESGTLDDLERHIDRALSGQPLDDTQASEARLALIAAVDGAPPRIAEPADHLNRVLIYLIYGETDDPDFAPGTIEQQQAMDDLRCICSG